MLRALCALHASDYVPDWRVQPSLILVRVCVGRALAGLRTWASSTRPAFPEIRVTGTTSVVPVGLGVLPHRGGTVPDFHRIPFSFAVREHQELNMRFG
jgi:hypothetical protein